MDSKHQIETTIFCTYHDIDGDFIDSLADYGLIELKVIERKKFIAQDQLTQLEKMIRMHRELDINIAGIQAVVNLLERFENLQQENLSLRNQLRFYIE